MYLAKHVGNWSIKTIGRYYGGRDHSTVCYGIQRIEALRDSDANVDALVCDLRRHLLQEHDGHLGGRCDPELPALDIRRTGRPDSRTSVCSATKAHPRFYERGGGNKMLSKNPGTGSPASAQRNPLCIYVTNANLGKPRLALALRGAPRSKGWRKTPAFGGCSQGKAFP
jgi:hypothetical protein